jgi:hypothetical protein
MKLHLYEFRLPEGQPLYVISSGTSDEVRACHDIWDHGGMPQETFVETFERGICREVINLEGIADPEELPHLTCEKVYCKELGGDYLDLGDVSIDQFLDDYYGNEYPDETWSGMQLMLRRCIVELEKDAAVFSNEANVMQMLRPEFADKIETWKRWSEESQAVAEQAKLVLEESRNEPRT